MSNYRFRQVISHLQSEFPPRQATVVGLTIVWFASCTLTDLSHLNRGTGQGGDAGQGGIAGDAGQGGLDQAGGMSAGTSALGGARPAGAAGAAAGSRSLGGASGTTNNGQAGASNKAGSAGAPAVAGGGNVGTGGDTSCPAYVGTGGKLLTPPSNGFESNILSWSTTAAHTNAVSQVTNGVNPCEGSAYLTCSGQYRYGGGWDGPAIDIVANAIPGHAYVVTIAARFDPNAALAVPKNLRLVVAKFCADTAIGTEYTRLQETLSSGNWVRLGGQFLTDLAGCTALRRLQIYVESEDADVALTIHVDDFRIYDMTTSTGAGGAAGSSGVSNAGASGAIGMAGSTGVTLVTSAGTSG